MPGVIGVTANGNLRLKSFYSSYGVGSAQVVAPGGDSDPAAHGGRPERAGALDLAGSLLTSPACRAAGRRRQRGDVLLPAGHLDGLAARRRRRRPDREPASERSPGAVAAKINPGRPDGLPRPSKYAFFPAVDNGAPQVCQGGTGYNSFNGHGQVNALTAVH